MTLVVLAAASNKYLHPLLFGDSLISAENQNPDYIGIDLPSKIGIDRFGMHTTNWGTIAPTLVSKVQIVHPQIAVGWTGQKFAAEAALKAMKDNVDQNGLYPE